MSRYPCPRVKTTLNMKLYAKENFSRKNCYNKAIKHEQQAR